MPRAGTLDLLRRVLEKEFAIPADDVRPGALLAEDLDLDSLDRAHLATALDEHEICLSDEQLASARSVEQLAALVDACAGSAGDRL